MEFGVSESITKPGVCPLGGHQVHRVGYGAMQLAGDMVFGPPRDRDEAIAVLRAAVAVGVDHIGGLDSGS
jgi:pyridoxine 4-dehydrogenase